MADSDLIGYLSAEQFRAALAEAGVPVSAALTPDAGAAKLREYWVHGEGAAKIRWGSAGDFDRCVRHLGKYVSDPKGLCNTYHQEALGAPPGKGHAAAAAPATGSASLRGVELARPGTFVLASGKTTFTEEMLADAADFYAATGRGAIPVGLGHMDQRFDGDPAFGWVENIRYHTDARGPVLLGDLVDMPAWLAAEAPKRWRNRSIEAFSNVEFGGRTYAMALTRLALLGATPPGIPSISSLSDLQQALAASTRMVASIADPEPDIVAAVSDKPWSGFGQGDYTDAQWYRACLVHLQDPPRSKGDCKVPVREPDGTLNRNAVHAAAGGHGIAAVQGISPEQRKTAARALVGLYRGQLKEDPPASLLALAGMQASASSDQEGAGMDPAKLREALGLSPDASDQEVTSALAAAGLTTPSPTPPPDQPADPPGNPPVQAASLPADAPQPLAAAAAAAGAVVLDRGVWEQAQAQIAEGVAAARKLREQERDTLITAAVADGRIPPANRGYWENLWNGQPKATGELIASLRRNAVPVEATGYPGGDDEDAPDQYAHLFPPTPKER